MKQIFLVCLVSFAFSIEAATKEEAYINFRDAFLKKDFQKLKSIAKFPIEVKGELDSDPSFKVTEKNFVECFSKIFTKEVGIVEVQITHEDYIKEHSDLKVIAKNPTWGIDLKSKDSFRIADIEFSEKEFKIERFYLDTKDVSVKKVCHH